MPDEVIVETHRLTFSIRDKSLYKMSDAAMVAIREWKNPIRVGRNGGCVFVFDIKGYSVMFCFSIREHHRKRKKSNQCIEVAYSLILLL
jgi:hypothetical protein